jgi:hypothetical protein
MTNWQPIETAPKDRTVLLVVEPTEQNFLFFGSHGPNTAPYYIDPDGVICDPGQWMPDPGIRAGKWRATHWMPLPEPPKEGV